MTIPVSSRVHRTIRKMDRYHAFDDLDKIHKPYPIKLELDENLIGVFENIPNQIKESIVITDKGLHYCFENDRSEKVNYKDIISTNYPEPEKKRTEEVLTLYLNNGDSFPLFIKSKSANQRFNDLFNWMRFILRVRDDIKPE